MKWISRELQSRIETGKKACETCAMRDRCDSIRRDASIEKEWHEKGMEQGIKIANDRAEASRASPVAADHPEQGVGVKSYTTVEDGSTFEFLDGGSTTYVVGVAHLTDEGDEPRMYMKTLHTDDDGVEHPRGFLMTEQDGRELATFMLNACDRLKAEEAAKARRTAMVVYDAAKTTQEVIDALKGWTLEVMCEKANLNALAMAWRISLFPKGTTWQEILYPNEVVAVCIAMYKEIVTITARGLEPTGEVKVDE